MIYGNARDWSQTSAKRVMVFGMSGLGKTHVSAMLRAVGSWFHYSIDYRIGTRYMGEHIVDNFKREAMKTPFLAHLLKTDSIYIASNITFENLAPLSTYLGKPGDPAKGGLPFEEYMHRQGQHRTAEIAALLDSAHFIGRARDIYGYENFICDTGGSICEVVDPDDPSDPVLTALSDNLLPVWIEGNEAHTEELARRFDRAPKPMYYEPAFLRRMWKQYLELNSLAEDAVDPDAFVRWAYRQAMAHRQPKYRAMAEKWGVSVTAREVSEIASPEDFDALIARSLETQTGRG